MTAWWVLRADARTVEAPAPAAGLAPAADLVALEPAAATPVPSEPAQASAPGEAASAAPAPAEGEVTVDVAGEVRRPGVVTLAAGARVVDALGEAGGARPGVDLSPLNLARVLVDGEQVLVGAPSTGATTAGAPASGAAPTAPAPAAAAGTAYDARLAAAFGVFPDDLETIRRDALAFFRYHLVADHPAAGGSRDLDTLVAAGAVRAEPIVYEDFLPQALAEGRYVAAPEPSVVGQGIGRIQAGLDAQLKGVSAQKLVVAL